MPKKSLKGKEIFLHIGLHKTGTTFLQKEVFPKIKDIEFHDRKYLIYDMQVNQNKKILFSGERYSVSMPHYRYVYECNDALLNLKKLFPDAKIIVGFRDKKEWLYSCYYQFIKGAGGFLSFDSYLEKYKEHILDFEKYLLEIRSLWEDVFVYDFAEFRKDPHVVVGKICAFMDVDVPSFENRRYNVSMSKHQIFVLSIINFVVSLNGKIPAYKIVQFFIHLLRRNAKNKS